MVYNLTMKKMMHRLFARSMSLVVLALLSPTTLFAYEAAPLSSTIAPTMVTEQSAKLNGKVNPTDAPDTYAWFEWGISGRTGSELYETRHIRVSGGYRSQRDVSESIVGLAPNTQYFYRVVAENSRGKDMGQMVYFTTKNIGVSREPISLIETREATYVNESGATLEAYMSPHGNSKAQYWFEWGTTLRFENTTPHRTKGGSSGIVKEKLTRLDSGTTYYFRAVTESSEGRFAGTLKVFHTSGNPPPASETPRAQTVSVTSGDDGVARRTTTSGVPAGTENSARATNQYGLPKLAGGEGGRPGDFWGALVRGVSGRSAGKTTGSATEQSSSVANATQSPLARFWNSLTGKKGVTVAVEKFGPKTITLHSTVEYRVSYKNNSDMTIKNAMLAIALPREVVYIGDNTTNELLLEEGVGDVRTYVLPIAELPPAGSRTISLLGMTTSEASGLPEVSARLEYRDASGLQVIYPVSEKALSSSSKENTASVGNTEGNGILPSSLLGWVFYVLFIAGSIFIYRKAKEYYLKRKELLEENESDLGGEEELERMIPEGAK